MSKKSELRQALDHLDVQIAILQQAKAALLATQDAIGKNTPKRVRKPKPEQAA